MHHILKKICGMRISVPFFKTLALAFTLLFLAASLSFAAGTASDITIDVKEFRLTNGMMFLVVERHTTPQVACRLAIRAGSALEDTGKTGIAHMLEHMMFKGTKNFGTLDTERDRELQKKIEVAYQGVLAEQEKRNPNQDLIREKLEEMKNLRTEVQEIYVPQAFSSQLGRNGAVGINAFTSKDQTQYLCSVPSDMLEQWFSMISEQLFEPSWREFYVEKEVVQREWAFRYINSPGGAAWLDLNATAYAAHPYGNPTIGWKSDMERYSTRDAIDFHHTYYNPTNAVCVLVGDVRAEDAERLAKIYFERYPAGRRSPEIVTEEPSQQGPRRSVRFLKGARTPLVRIGFHGAPMGTKDFYALDVMTMVLSLGRSARITQHILNKGLAVEAWAYNPDNRYGGMIILGGSPNEPDLEEDMNTEEELRQSHLKSCRQLEDLLLAQADIMKEQLVSAHDLERIKKLNRREFLERMRSNEKLAGTVATLEVQVGWQYLADYLDRIAEVTPEDIRDAARKYLRTENQTSVYVIPGGEPDQPPEPYTEVRSLGIATASRLAAAPDTFNNNSIYPTPEGWRHPLSFNRQPQKISYPKPHTTRVGDTLIFYLPDRELPLIDLTLLVQAGEVDIDEARTGLAGILSDIMLRGGTQRYSPSDLARIIDENAIRVLVSVDEEASSVHLSVMKGDWKKGLELLEEILVRPAFDENVLDVIKGQAMAALNRQADEAQAVAMREGMIWHFHGHPYGRDPLIGLKTIPDITADDLKNFMRTYFVPSNMVAAVSGDIDFQKATAGLNKLFAALPQSKAPERRLGEPGENKPVLAVIDKPGQVQSQVVLVLPGFKRTHPAFWKARLLADIFGGSDSLMYTRLRDDLGLVYSAGFFQTYKWNAGLLMGYIGCRGDRTVTSIEETSKIMSSLRSNIPQRDFELKRLDALNSFVFNVDTPAGLVEVYSSYYMRQEPLDTLDRIQDAYLQATRDELRDLAVELLDPEKLQIFIVADKKTPVKRADGTEINLEQDLKLLAERMGIPYQEIALR